MRAQPARAPPTRRWSGQLRAGADCCRHDFGGFPQASSRDTSVQRRFCCCRRSLRQRMKPTSRRTSMSRSSFHHGRSPWQVRHHVQQTEAATAAVPTWASVLQETRCSARTARRRDRLPQTSCQPQPLRQLQARCSAQRPPSGLAQPQLGGVPVSMMRQPCRHVPVKAVPKHIVLLRPRFDPIRMSMQCRTAIPKLQLPDHSQNPAGRMGGVRQCPGFRTCRRISNREGQGRHRRSRRRRNGRNRHHVTPVAPPQRSGRGQQQRAWRQGAGAGGRGRAPRAVWARWRARQRVRLGNVR